MLAAIQHNLNDCTVLQVPLNTLLTKHVIDDIGKLTSRIFISFSEKKKPLSFCNTVQFSFSAVNLIVWWCQYQAVPQLPMTYSAEFIAHSSSHLILYPVIFASFAKYRVLVNNTVSYRMFHVEHGRTPPKVFYFYKTMECVLHVSDLSKCLRPKELAFCMLWLGTACIFSSLPANGKPLLSANHCSAFFGVCKPLTVLLIFCWYISLATKLEIFGGRRMENIMWTLPRHFSLIKHV